MFLQIINSARHTTIKFKRKLLSKLKSWMEHDHLCLVLKGQRQVGKTTIAEYFGKLPQFLRWSAQVKTTIRIPRKNYFEGFVVPVHRCGCPAHKRNSHRVSSSAAVHEAVEVLRIVGPAGAHEVPDIVLGLVLEMHLGGGDGPVPAVPDSSLKGTLISHAGRSGFRRFRRYPLPKLLKPQVRIITACLSAGP